jgi:hypothetical protein
MVVPGAAEGTRTPTQRIKSPLLCHSSSDGSGGVLARIRTWNFRFAGGGDRPFHHEDRKEPSPGIEPGFPPYQGGVFDRWTMTAKPGVPCGNRTRIP